MMEANLTAAAASAVSTEPPLFELSPELEAHEPAEARGFGRDDVRLMVSYRSNDRIVHSQFRALASSSCRGTYWLSIRVAR